MDGMKTDTIRIKKSDYRISEALEQAAKFSVYYELGKKDSMRLRLLTEEVIGMLSGIAGDFEADFWIEGGKKGCVLNIEGETLMNRDKRRRLMSVSTEGKNILAKGVMGKIRSIFESMAESYSDDEYSGIISYGLMNDQYDPISNGFGYDYQMNDSSMWSLNAYREAVERNREKDSETVEAWDELEKSLVAKLSDEVRIGISGEKVKMLVFRKYENR